MFHASTGSRITIATATAGRNWAPDREFLSSIDVGPRPAINLEAMHTTNSLLTITASLLLAAATCCGDEWMTWSSTYTHDPYGNRVDQYAQPVAPVAPHRADFQRSGYRNYRSTLQTGQSADNMHIVEQWGRNIVPYEQWRFPFRPYGVPYDAWGPQLPYGQFNGQLNGNFGSGFFPGGAYPSGGLNAAPFSAGPLNAVPGLGPVPGYAPAGLSPYGFGQGRGFPLQPQYQQQPWYDGTYPSAPPLDPRSDAEFFSKPTR
ncbi:MAG: hypothetical protein R3C53_17485 [Pirellulaceae bacterium]